MWIAVQTRFRLRNSDLRQQLNRTLPRRLPDKAAMQKQDFCDLLLDRMQRIERRHRLLENDGDVVPAHMANFPLAELQKLLPFEANGPGRVARSRIRQELENRQGGDGFPGTGFA